MRARVLHLIPTLDRGGTEVTALAIAREFARRGIVNRVAALEAGARMIEEAFADVANEVTVLPPSRPSRARSMRALVHAFQPDAVLFHFFNAEHLVLGAAARLAGVRNLVAVLGNPIAAGAAMARKMRLLVRLTDLLGIRVIAASHWIERSLMESRCLPRHRCVIHNGCDILAIGARGDAARVRRSSDAVIGMVSRLDPIKDHATLLAAFAMLPETMDGRRVRLVLVGDGIMRGSLEAQALSLDISDRITFVGAVRDVPEITANFDVFAFSTTRDEGFGIVLIEALASGTPVVASDVPACREVLDGGALGQLVPPGNPNLLAQALLETLVAPATVPARSDVARLYGVEPMVDAYVAVLFSASARSRTGASRDGNPRKPLGR